MNSLKLAWKNLWHNRLRSLLSVVLFATGVAIILTLLLTGEQLDKNLKKNRAGVDMVVSAPGSKLQMMLSSVYHIDKPTGNVALDEVAFLFKNPTIDAYPISLGDNYKGVRIVGTDKRYIELYKGEISKGKLWDKELQAVIGSEVAKKFKLKVGDKISGSHGLVAGADVHDDHPYLIVGVLKPSHSVLDKLILCHFASVWKVHEGHDHSHGDHSHDHGHSHGSHSHAHNDEHVHGETETKKDSVSQKDSVSHSEHQHHAEVMGQASDTVKETPKEKARRIARENARESLKKSGVKAKFHEILKYTGQNKELTAVLINVSGGQAINFIPRYIEGKESLDLAMVQAETDRLYPLIEPGVAIVKWIAMFIVFISAFSIWISLFQSLKERKYELALLRVMGGTQLHLFLIVLLEGILLSLLGFLAGFLIAHGITNYIGLNMATDYNMEMTGWYFSNKEVGVLLFAILLGFVSAILPSFLATRINIPKTLANK